MYGCWLAMGCTLSGSIGRMRAGACTANGKPASCHVDCNRVSVQVKAGTHPFTGHSRIDICSTQCEHLTTIKLIERRDH